MAKSEAVLPAYLVGMVLAPFFLANKTLSHRMRVTAFTILTPFYFLKAGSLVQLSAIWNSALLIGMFLLLKVSAKFIGIWPTMEIFRIHEKREHVYNPADVDRPDIRLDFCFVWLYK